MPGCFCSWRLLSCRLTAYTVFLFSALYLSAAWPALAQGLSALGHPPSYYIHLACLVRSVVDRVSCLACLFPGTPVLTEITIMTPDSVDFSFLLFLVPFSSLLNSTFDCLSIPPPSLFYIDLSCLVRNVIDRVSPAFLLQFSSLVSSAFDCLSITPPTLLLHLAC